MLENIDHFISILSGIVMGIIGIYTAYLTLYCKTISLISYKKMVFSGREEHIKFVIKAYNKSLSPICISRLYLIFNGTHYIELKIPDKSLIIQARTAIEITSEDIFSPEFNFSDIAVLNAPIFLLSMTNKGISVSGFHYANKKYAICFYIKSLLWKYKTFYQKLKPIKSIAYMDECHHVAVVVCDTIKDDSFALVTVINSEINLPDK